MADAPHPTDREPLRRDAERNRERILAAARELIGTRGLEVSHDDIARAADVGVGTVYRRFPTREALLDELFFEQLDVMVATAQAAAALEDPWQGICQFLEQYFEQQIANRGLGELLIGHRGGTELSRRAQSRLRPIVAELVTRARAAGQIQEGIGETDIAMIPVMINALLAASRDVDSELWRRWLAIILDGIATAPSRTRAPGRPPTPAEVEQIIKGPPPTRPR